MEPSFPDSGAASTEARESRITRSRRPMTGARTFGAAGLALCALALSGCAALQARLPARPEAAPSAAPSTAAEVAPEIAAIVAAPPPPRRAVTVAEYDTTTPEQRAAAAAPEAAAERLLGTTVASLGDPTAGGLWIETPLADAPGPGRIVYAETGKTALVEIRPLDGPVTAGSRVSLAAMRLVEAPLAGLPTLEVYAR